MSDGYIKQRLERYKSCEILISSTKKLYLSRFTISLVIRFTYLFMSQEIIDLVVTKRNFFLFCPQFSWLTSNLDITP